MKDKRRALRKVIGPLEVLDTRAVPAVFTTGPGVPGSGFDPTPLSAPFHPVLRASFTPHAVTTAGGASSNPFTGQASGSGGVTFGPGQFRARGTAHFGGAANFSRTLNFSTGGGTTFGGLGLANQRSLLQTTGRVAQTTVTPFTTAGGFVSTLAQSIATNVFSGAGTGFGGSPSFGASNSSFTGSPTFTPAGSSFTGTPSFTPAGSSFTGTPSFTPGGSTFLGSPTFTPTGSIFNASPSATVPNSIFTTPITNNNPFGGFVV